MSGGLKCNPLTVSLVTIGTLITITCMFIFVIINKPFDFDTCEEDSGAVVETEVTRYGIVIRIDMSTSTPQPKLFSWSYDINRTMSPVESQPYSCQQETKTLEKPRMFLQSCLETISRVIPADNHQDTEVYLITRDTVNSAQPPDSLTAVREIIAIFPFNTSRVNTEAPFAVTDDDIARYQWIIENAALGNLNSDSTVGRGEEALDMLRPTHGLLNIRTTSLRITFAVTGGGDVTTLTPTDEWRQMRVYSEKYTLYTREFPCYGLNAADARFKKRLVLEMYNSSAEGIVNPCAPSGSFETLTNSTSDLRCSTPAPASADRHLPVSLPGETEPSNHSEEARYTLEGVGQSEDCRRQMKMLILDGEELPAPQGDIIALFPKLPFVLDDIAARDFSTICNWTNTPKPTDTFLTEGNSTSLNPCFVATYLKELISEGLKIDQATWDRTVIREEGGVTELNEEDWIHGFMISTASELIPPPLPCMLSEANRLVLERKQAGTTAVIVLILSGLLLVCLGYGIACKRGGDNNWVPSPLAMYQFEEN